jgi:hypothetical protein
MGKHIVRVPPGFTHPGSERDDPVPGAHFEILYGLDPAACTCYQVYEDVTEGTPVSPVFDSVESLQRWLLDEGYSKAAAEAFLAEGCAPSFVVTGAGEVLPGIEGLKKKDGAS